MSDERLRQEVAKDLFVRFVTDEDRESSLMDDINDAWGMATQFVSAQHGEKSDGT